MGAAMKLIPLSRSVPEIKNSKPDDSLNNMFICMPVFVCLCVCLNKGRKLRPVCLLYLTVTLCSDG